MKKIELYFYVLTLCFAICTLSACSDDDTGKIEGTVTYSELGENKVLGDAIVRLYVAKVADNGVIEGDSNLTPIRETTTDAEGKYSFSGVKTGNFWITAIGEVDGTSYSTAKLSPVGVMLIGGRTEVVDIVVQ